MNFNIKFQKTVKVDNPPLFVLRSVIGKNLKKACCVSEKSKCRICLFNQKCTYAFLFDHNSIENRSHPFAFKSAQNIKINGTIDEYNFDIVFFNMKSEYIQLIYQAVKKSGEEGIFKKRCKFIIQDVKLQDSSILSALSQDCLDINLSCWKFPESKTEKKGEVLLLLKTPLRFKVNGKYTSDFTVKDLMSCFVRRAKKLCTYYGQFLETDDCESPINFDIAEKQLFWQNFVHYSARQKKSMELGGNIGYIKLAGSFSEQNLAVFELNKIANAGKNTIFGLGQIDYWEKLR